MYNKLQYHELKSKEIYLQGVIETYQKALKEVQKKIKEKQQGSGINGNTPTL